MYIIHGHYLFSTAKDVVEYMFVCNSNTKLIKHISVSFHEHKFFQIRIWEFSLASSYSFDS